MLREDGTIWCNLGDSYAANQVNNRNGYGPLATGHQKSTVSGPRKVTHGLKPKDLVGMPWRVAFALQDDGWYLRSDIIWAKPNPMPESVRDRPTKAHEYLFLLSKNQRYYFDQEAVRESWKPESVARDGRGYKGTFRSGAYGFNGRETGTPSEIRSGRNIRTVWNIPTQPYPEAHYATYPEKLVEPCVLAGTSPKACGVCGGPWERVVERKAMLIDRSYNHPLELRTRTSGTMVEPAKSTTTGWEPTCSHNDDSGLSIVVDIFSGSGTTGVVAKKLGRKYIGIDLKAEYLDMSIKRINATPVPMALDV